jgi:hypothetical protein
MDMDIVFPISTWGAKDLSSKDNFIYICMNIYLYFDTHAYSLYLSQSTYLCMYSFFYKHSGSERPFKWRYFYRYLYPCLTFWYKHMSMYLHIIYFFVYTVFPISTQGAKDVSNEDILIAEGTATLELAGRYLCPVHRYFYIMYIYM